MVMKRLALIALLLAGCNKPTEDSCKKAIENMRKLLGTSSYTADISPDVRRCRGGSTQTAVDCAGNAKTKDALAKCEFVHFDMNPGSGSGSAVGSGSAK
jgi:hypothetical protein